jgi:hypothetical protein
MEPDVAPGSALLQPSRQPDELQTLSWRYGDYKAVSLTILLSVSQADFSRTTTEL